jgi:hypothetical protein
MDNGQPTDSGGNEPAPLLLIGVALLPLLGVLGGFSDCSAERKRRETMQILASGFLQVAGLKGLDHAAARP